MPRRSTSPEHSTAGSLQFSRALDRWLPAASGEIAYTGRDRTAMLSKPITSGTIRRTLFLGFSLVILLLLAAAFIGVQSTHEIKGSAAGLVQERYVTTRLIDEIQREQGTLNAIFQNLSGQAGEINRVEILARLTAWEDEVRRIVDAARGTPEQQIWAEVGRASQQFAGEARHVLTQPRSGSIPSRDLLGYHNRVMSAIAELIAESYHKSEEARAQIEARSEELRRNSLILLGACLVLALACAALTMKMVAMLFREMEWQTGELSRVSWQLLENQEATARRFSHELHDELGQSLTAVKANLLALRGSDGDRRRLDDCDRLVDEAIRNARELSQLLRPTILDDFGLDVSLRWLCEGFTQRTGIEVEYASDFDGRLADETETHLFRIAQEALTNVARHSGARAVRMSLRRVAETIQLSIADNGRGIPAEPAVSSNGLGMVGMRARARNAGGELLLFPEAGGGLRIEAKLPARDKAHEQDSHRTGR